MSFVDGDPMTTKRMGLTRSTSGATSPTSAAVFGGQACSPFDF
jgi:hypothetical protein